MISLVSPAEARVLNALVEHGKDKLVARATGLESRTVHSHLYNVRKKLRAAGFSEGDSSPRVALMRWWMQQQACIST
jgi:DNA-binding CsgD family transcriptional regulator